MAPPPACVFRRCIGIVARGGVHVLIEITIGIAGVRPAEQTNGIHQRVVLFQAVRRVNRIRSNLFVKVVGPRTSRNTIGKENDHFLSVRSRIAQNAAGLVKTLIWIGVAIRPKIINNPMKGVGVLVINRRKPNFGVGIIRKRHDSKLMLKRLVIDVVIFLYSRINEIVNGTLKSLKTRFTAPASDVAPHRGRLIENQNNVKRFAALNHLFEVRGRRERGQAHEEVGVALFNRLAVQAGIVVVSERVRIVEHALIGPDATDVLRRRLAARTRVVRPNIRRIRVNNRISLKICCICWHCQ